MRKLREIIDHSKIWWLPYTTAHPLVIPGLILVLVMLLSGCSGQFGLKIESKPQLPQRLELQADELPGGHRTMIICDTATGNLIYLHYHSGEMAVVPNGCQKK